MNATPPHDPSLSSDTCLIQVPSDWCRNKPIVRFPWPICSVHALSIYHRMQAEIDAARNNWATSDIDLAAELEAEHQRVAAHRPPIHVVYYVRIHDFIKIGCSSALRQRLGQLRVDREALLATEPGGYDLERKRHLQFKHIRIGLRENFQPTDELVAHIAEIRKIHGEPQLKRDPYAPYDVMLAAAREDARVKEQERLALLERIAR